MTQCDVSTNTDTSQYTLSDLFPSIKCKLKVVNSFGKANAICCKNRVFGDQSSRPWGYSQHIVHIYQFHHPSSAAAILKKLSSLNESSSKGPKSPKPPSSPSDAATPISLPRLWFALDPFGIIGVGSEM